MNERTKKIVEKQLEEIRNQGRSRKQMESNYKIAFVSLVGLIGCVLYILITAS
jgi:hypothetical protein